MGKPGMRLPAGTDTVVIPATLGQTHVQAHGNGSFTLQRLTDGAMLDTTRVERVTFSDTKLALDLDGNAGQGEPLHPCFLHIFEIDGVVDVAVVVHIAPANRDMGGVQKAFFRHAFVRYAAA